MVAALIVEITAAVYSPCKDLYLCIKGERPDVNDLENRISELILNLTLIHSEFETNKPSLTRSVSTEKTIFHETMKAMIAGIDKETNKFINKYTRVTGNHLSATTPSLSIEMLNELKSKIATLNFFKLAKLSRDIAKLSALTSKAAKKLKPEHVIKKKEKLNQQKLYEDANVLPVFDRYVDDIMEYLFEDERYNCVGILGCQGSGKTTVLRNLYNRLLEESLSSVEECLKLDHIIRIDYPPVLETEEDKNMIVEKLQNEIMEQLEIPRKDSKSIVRNANTISTFLCDKKYALLMDHVFKYIDLEDLGVKQYHKYKKVVVCSSEKKVVRLMTEHVVEIRGLNEGEAMALIQIICGELYGRKREIAKRIVECCGGIPLLIHVVAVELKDKKDDYSWNYTRRCLLSDPKSPELMDLGPYAKVYEMKYEGLAADAKKCLLYCALFPLHHKINTDYLVECWIAEGFIVEEGDQKVRVSRERGLVILDKLTDDYLLQWCSGKKCVVMEPIFRRVALALDYPGGEKSVNWVASKDRNPDEAVWATVTRMSLIGCKMKLPKSPRCPNICTLLLQSLKQEAERLPESFFAHMESLKVLDLNQMEITTLPGSINTLVNLKSLYLNGCLGIVALPPQAASLVKLEFLDISGTLISTLPEVIRHMVNMRCLRASLSAKRGKQVEKFEVIIPKGIISSLKNLEEFSVVTDFDFQGGNGIAVAEKLAKELASLEHLNTLCFNFPNVSSLETFVTNSKSLKNRRTFWGTQTFQSFKIFVGRHEPPRRSQEPEFSGMLAERWLRHSTNERFPPTCHELLKLASALEIIGHDGLTSLTGSQFDLDQVKVCVVERCNRLENIVDGYKTSRNQESLLLPNLEKLYLYDLKMLKCIWSGPVPPKSLVNLTAVTVDGCPELTKILDPAWAQSLEKLEYLKVENCGKISKIIEGSGEISEDVELLKSLKRIEVSNLPELECICENPSSIRWKSLKSIIVKRCSKLRDLSLAHTSARKLPSIHCECEESWWNTLTSDDQLKLRVCFFKEESVEAGAQSRRGEASTGASGRPKARKSRKFIPWKPKSSSEKPSRRLEEKYEVEESRLEGKKMEHEHPGTDQPFSTLSGDDVRQDQYGGTSAGASFTEVKLQKENFAGNEPISTSESKLVPKTFPVDSSSSSLSIFESNDIFLKTSEAKIPSNMPSSVSGFISEHHREILEVDESRNLKPNLQKLDEDANALPIFDSYVDDIMEYLFEDEGYNSVGILGCEGSGKTTVLQKLYNRLLEESLSGVKKGLELDHIILIDNPPVSEAEEDKNMILEKLQKEMMEQLEIPHEASRSIVRNANTISTFLCGKKYALLMDHVFKYIDLEDLGVKQYHKYKKVVVCSSKKKVVRSMTDHMVEIRGLNEDEAMALIQNICGELYVRKRYIAKRIIKCCGGIRLVIRLVAIMLKDVKDDDVWNHMLWILRSDPKSPELMVLGPYAKVYEIKYEGLAADAKKCLLYCALFPLHHKINTDYLVDCWIAEGFIVEEAEQKVRVSRERGLVILDKLTDDYLLQWCSGKKYVVMQPIFRRVALKLNYPGEYGRQTWVQSWYSMPDEEDWAMVTRMSLIGCKMELPESPKSPNICTLLLPYLKQKAKRLSESFFAHMESLKVLDLNNSWITTLPGSIGKLVNLKSLYLNGCLGIVALPPEAARLERLEFLDISGTSISTLPEEIRHMVNIRCLRASLSAKGGKQVEEFEVIIPKGIISNLRNLEELSIVTDFEFRGENGIAVAERLAMELASLEHLNNLCFNFPNMSSLEKFVTNSKALNNMDTSWETHTFRSFEIFVGRHEPKRRYQEPEFSGMLAERWLRYSTNEEFPLRCHELLKQASALEIIGHDGLTSFTCSQFDLDPMKVCMVERCNSLENIVDGYITCENQESLLLPNLEKLYLYDLEMLKCIWDGPVPRKSLVNLITITIDGCPKLTKILDHGLACSLEKLEYLKVENCGQISKIIDVSGEISEVVELLKRLKRIELSNLPELQCICEKPTSISWKSLKSIIVKRCSKLRDLSLAHTNDRNLPSIHCECEESWWNTLTSDDKQKLRGCFFKEESIEGGAQSRREEASTSACGSSKAITAAFSKNIDYEVLSDDLTQESEDEMMYDRPSRRLEEKYEVEESRLEGKKMEHEHPGTDQPFSTLSGDDVRQDQYGGTSAGASSTSEPISTSESSLTGFISEHNREIQEVDVSRNLKPNLQKLDEDANALPVFDRYVDDIMEYLFEDEGYNSVGILGCEGSGKTTVLQKLYNRLLEESLSGVEEGLKLDHIILIDNPPVSETEEDKNMIVEKLQNEIMEQLKIPHKDSKSLVRNANTISTFLCDKKYVLLMDQVSRSIDLEDLGVKQNHRYKKVVVCSSEKKVVRSMTEHMVEIRGLNEGEAMVLIQNICGELYGPKREIAKRIIESCGGIPLVIRLVAVELKDRADEYWWNNILRCLHSDPKFPELMDLGPYAKVYEIKYEGLAADVKECLLYCALFPLHHKINTDYLVECWIAEGFIVEEADQKVRVSRELGQVILEKLTDAYLLQWCSGKKYVMMQPIFRRVALELEYPGGEKCMNWVPSKDRKPDETAWATVTRMSLIGCKMNLPKSPICPNICTLLLQSLRQEAKHLPESFFAHMESLRVLDLNQMDITTLPGSIGKLVNLKSLYLNGCLGIVALPPQAARLERLEFLDISGTSISTLPEEIRHMVNMRCLRASHKVIIPPGIISSLKNLEELSVVTDFDFQGENGIVVAEILAKELASLEHLNTLCFNFPNASSLETFVTNSKALENKTTFGGTETFRSFKIRVGHETRRRFQEPDQCFRDNRP